MGDLRESARRRTLKGGKIVFSSLFASIDCVVRNLSPGGACLEVESQHGIPDDFDLMVAADGSLRKCLVAWRSGNQIGVTFLSRSDSRESGHVRSGPRAEKRTEFGWGISGLVEVEGSPDLLSCRVLDTSPSGAKLQIEHAERIGDKFRLRLSKGGAARHCKVIWRAGDVVGVSVTAQTS